MKAPNGVRALARAQQCEPEHMKRQQCEIMCSVGRDRPCGRNLGGGEALFRGLLGTCHGGLSGRLVCGRVLSSCGDL